MRNMRRFLFYTTLNSLIRTKCFFQISQGKLAKCVFEFDIGDRLEMSERLIERILEIFRHIWPRVRQWSAIKKFFHCMIDFWKSSSELMFQKLYIMKLS